MALGRHGAVPPEQNVRRKPYPVLSFEFSMGVLEIWKWSLIQRRLVPRFTTGQPHWKLDNLYAGYTQAKRRFTSNAGDIGQSPMDRSSSQPSKMNEQSDRILI